MNRFTRALAPYAAAITALALATGIAAALELTSVPRGVYGFVFLLVMLGSAWWGGYGPGFVVTALTVTVVPFALIRGYSSSRINLSTVVLLLIVSLLVSRVAAATREREAMLRESNDLLDDRVRRRTQELERANAALHERETLLLRQADELARSNADLQQFAYVASHDLQEPLRLIAIYTELLKRRYGGQMDSEADRFLGVIVDGVRRMETLIRDLLSYSRVIHAETPAEREQVDVAETLKLAVANL